MPTLTNYHWNPINDSVLMETGQSGNTIATYMHEPGQFGPLISENRGGTQFFHHYDAIGSTTFLTNSAGTVTDTFVFDSWGSSVSRTGTTATPYQWVGRWGYQFDASTGNYYIRARSFEPLNARWTSVDPSFLAKNQFVYSLAAPTQLLDQSGAQAGPPPLPNAKESFAVQLDRVCNQCGFFTLQWSYQLKANSAYNVVFVVQKICRYDADQDCVLQGNPACCIDSGAPRIGNCCVYEQLGVRNKGQVPRADVWGLGGPQVVAQCSGVGLGLMTAEVRGFAVPAMFVITGPKNTWKSGPKLCGEQLYVFGPYMDQEPAGWNDYGVVSFTGATASGGCCRSQQGGSVAYFSTGIAGVWNC